MFYRGNNNDNHMTFGGHKVYYFMARVASRDTNKLYAEQKSFDHRYYQYNRPNRKNSFNKKKLLNRDVA